MEFVLFLLIKFEIFLLIISLDSLKIILFNSFVFFASLLNIENDLTLFIIIFVFSLLIILLSLII